MFFGKKKKKEISLEFSAPQSFAHEGHLSFNAQNKGFEARNLPPELQGVFQELNELLVQYGLKGISKKEAQYLLKVVGEKIGKSVADVPQKGKIASSPSTNKIGRTSSKAAVTDQKLSSSARASTGRRNTIDSGDAKAPGPISLDLDQPAKLSLESTTTPSASDDTALTSSARRKTESLGTSTKVKKPKKEDLEFEQKMHQVEEDHRLLIESLNAQIKNLEAEEQQALQDWEPQAAALQEETSALESQVSSKRLDLEALQAKTSAAQATLTQASAKLTSTQSAADEKLNQKQRLIDALKQQELEITAEKEAFAKLEEDIVNTRARCEELSEKETKFAAELNSLTQELESQKQQDNQQSSQLESTLNDMRAQMQTRISSLEERLNEAGKTRATLQAEIGSNKNELAAKDKFERNYQEEMRQLQANLSRYADEFKHADERARAAEDALAKAQTQFETSEAAEKRYIEQQKVSEAENDEYRDQLAVLYTNIENIEKQLSVLRSRAVVAPAPSDTPSAPSSSGGGPPPPPPPPPSGGAPPPPPIKAPAPPPPKPASSPSTSTSSSSRSAGGAEGLMSAIQRGTTLKKVETKEATPGAAKLPEEGLLGSLAKALLDRRANMGEDEEDDDDELLWD